jgi:chromosome segregation ATPase
LSSGNTTPEFNAAIGRANVGKSGRVIEKLSGERDMLRRDLKLAQLNTDECRKATRMAEERMEAQASEYEGRLHEASINKSLLERKLRQVEELKTQIDGEREKAQRAKQMEEYWKKQHDDNEDSCREKVQMAEEKAKHKERMVTTMTNHWKDKGAEVDRTVSRLGKEIKCLVDDRRNDDVQIQRLNNLCEQQSEQLKKLAKEKAAIQQQFEDYKKLQDESLAKIKASAAAMETHCTEVTKMATDTLGELRWALAVKRDLRSDPPEHT